MKIFLSGCAGPQGGSGLWLQAKQLQAMYFRPHIQALGASSQSFCDKFARLWQTGLVFSNNIKPK
ncbi:MAG: hypothetical protein Q8O38_07980 [Sulfurimicrobium sp.]|nr:hypothetical protein [Sulfurimicrobium sp.]